MIESAGGIVYYLEKGIPKYLLIKRLNRSGKVERVAPKGKMEDGEQMQQTALREVFEETWIKSRFLRVQAKVGRVELRANDQEGHNLDKNMSFYLMRYFGDPDFVRIQKQEGYVGVYKWYTIEEVLGLIYYKTMRTLMVKAHDLVQATLKKVK